MVWTIMSLGDSKEVMQFTRTVTNMLASSTEELVHMI